MARQFPRQTPVAQAILVLFTDCLRACSCREWKAACRASWSPPGLDAERGAFARTVTVAGLLIAAIWLFAMSRWILSDSVVPWDSKNQFYAFYRFLASSLHAAAPRRSGIRITMAAIRPLPIRSR